MSEPQYARQSIMRVFLTYFSLGIVVFCITLVVGTAGLYAWATTVNTCQKRERYSVLSFLEQTMPLITTPIQHVICP